MGSYIHIPNAIDLQEIVNNNFSLSSSQYVKLVMPNKNYKFVRDFLKRPLNRKDLGVEVGSLNYIDESPYLFIRTQAFQEHSFLLDINKESALPIMPSVFVQMNLKEGDVLISKDSNIGEVIILDKDYPNCMLSGAIYRLPVKDEWRYYLLALIKHPIFREQLDFMVPKGATIRHAKTKFLDCQIPLPNKNAERVVRFISVLTQAIVNKETIIHQRHTLISQLIERELDENQNASKFVYKLPRLNELEEMERLDSCVYGIILKKNIHRIKNYKRGYFQVDERNIRGGNTPTIRHIGNESVLKYQWVTPSYCSDYGTLTECRINFQGTNNLTQNAILIINRTSKGGLGEFVGISGYYNFSELGVGHHNQGIYRIEKYDETKLLFILCCLNCKIYRQICAALSVGSKMKELKIKQILMIPFPDFPEQKQKEIVALYYNPQEYNTHKFSLENFLARDNEFNSAAGIYELDKSAKYLKDKLNKAIDDIVNDREVKIEF